MSWQWNEELRGTAGSGDNSRHSERLLSHYIYSSNFIHCYYRVKTKRNLNIFFKNGTKLEFKSVTDCFVGLFVLFLFVIVCGRNPGFCFPSYVPPTSILHPYMNNDDVFEGYSSFALHLIYCITVYELHEHMYMYLVGMQPQQELLTNILKCNHALCAE